MVKIECKCKDCGKVVPVLVTEQQSMDLERGMKKVQLILPYSEYTPEQREMFISGLCNECWNKLFPPEEEDELTTEECNEINDEIHETFIHEQHLIKTGTSLN